MSKKAPRYDWYEADGYWWRVEKGGKGMPTPFWDSEMKGQKWREIKMKDSFKVAAVLAVVMIIASGAWLLGFADSF